MGRRGQGNAVWFFMPEWGYWSGDGNWKWYVSDNGTDETRAAYSMPEFRRALDELIGLWRGGLLRETVDLVSAGRQLADYPAVMLYFYEFMDSSRGFSSQSGFSYFNAGGYRIYALYGDKMPVYENEGGNFYTTNLASSGWQAVAGPNAEIGEFLRFMEWLDIRENYISLFYGTEGEDHILENGRIVPLERDGIKLSAVRNNLSFLERNELNAVTLNAPRNYEDEMRSLKPAYTITAPEESGALFDDFADAYGGEWNMALNETTRDYYDFLLTRLFRSSGDAPGEEEVYQIIDEYIEKQYGRKDTLEGYAGLIGEFYKAAADKK
jgi:hypothetical protein